MSYWIISENIKQFASNKIFNINILTEVKGQVASNIGEVVQGTVHIFSEGVRFPQEALGFFSLERNYDKKVALSNNSVRNWMKPTFVTGTDSKKQMMGLDIYFDVMRQEDSSRVN